MALGTYGITRPSTVNVEDVEVFYNYKPKRSSEDANYQSFHRLEASQVLEKATSDDITDIPDNTLVGMYRLKLPLDQFGQPGVYTVYLKPREIPCTITKIGNLSAYPDVRGIVVDLTNAGLDDATGYRVEYFNESGTREDFFRIVTSCGHCEPVSQAMNSTFSDSTGYRYNNAASLSFLTVTPSTATDFNSNDVPFIGKPDQQIVLVNTKFNPVALELEVVEYDAENLAYMLMGNSVRDLDRGLCTVYNFNNEIFWQGEFYTLKSTYNSTPKYTVRENRGDNIDQSQAWENVTGSTEN